MTTTPPGPTATVRPMTDADDLDHLNEGNPLAWHVHHFRTLADAVEMQWFVGSVDGRDVGLAVVVAMPFMVGGYGSALLTVRPEGRRRGVATALRRACEDAARGAVPGVVYEFADDDLEAQAAVSAWGLTVSERHHEAVLDLAAVDHAGFAARADVAGVVLAQLPAFDELGDDDWTTLHAFVEERFGEAPDSADGGGTLPFAVFRELVKEPWMMVTAREDGVLVGVTLVMFRPGSRVLANTFFTGVMPEHRGRGIATALKCRQALTMLEHGVTALYTQNMVGNEPILAANRTLGFVRDSTYCDVPVALS